jgi:hypothetical protein
VVQKLLEAIKEVWKSTWLYVSVFQFFNFNYFEEFRTSTQPLPQPFVLHFLANNIGPSVEQNPLTHETLTIVQHQK